MMNDTAEVIKILRVVLDWLDTQNMWHAAIDIDSAIARLGASPGADAGSAATQGTGLLH